MLYTISVVYRNQIFHFVWDNHFEIIDHVTELATLKKISWRCGAALLEGIGKMIAVPF